MASEEIIWRCDGRELSRGLDRIGAGPVGSCYPHSVPSRRGARHGTARFVTGRLDPFASREEQARAVQRTGVPVLNLLAETAPRKSRAEMEALTTLPKVKTVKFPKGKLSFYEEISDETSDAIRALLTDAR